VTPNPLTTIWRRKAARIYRDGGWGPLLSWPVARPGGDPLVFQMRLPARIELVDLHALAAETAAAPDRPEMALDRAAQVAGAIIVGALRSIASGDEPAEVLATLTVALSDVSGPPVAGDLAGGFSEDHHSHQEIIVLSDAVTLVKRLSAESVPGVAEPVAMLVMEFLIQTEFGAVAMVFATTHPRMINFQAQAAFQKMMETGYLGERPKPY
jgi:hypothetical protein